MRKIILTLIVLLNAFLIKGENDDSTKVNPIFQKIINYSFKTADLSIIRNTPYSEKRDYLLFDVYAPKTVEKNRLLPTVVFIHGDAPVKNLKDAGQYKSLGELVASEGFIGVTFNHSTLSNGNSVEEISREVNSLFNHIYDNAETYRIDKNQVVIWAMSAGTPFSLHYALQNPQENIKGIVIYYGLADLTSESKVIGVDISNENIANYCPSKLPVEKIDTNIPVFIARAGLDHPVINKSLDSFINRALRNNMQIDLYNHSTGRHAFDLLDDNQRTHEIIEKTISFIKKQL